MFNPGWLLHVRRMRLDAMSYIPGPILHKGALLPYLLTTWTPDSNYFHHLRPAYCMWSDHWPQTYQFVCEALSERLWQSTSKDAEFTLPDVLRRMMAYFAIDDSGPNFIDC